MERSGERQVSLSTFHSTSHFPRSSFGGSSLARRAVLVQRNVEFRRAASKLKEVD